MTKPTSIADLKLQGASPSHLARGLQREARIVPPQPKKEDLEKLYSDISARRLAALKDVEERGLIIIQECFSSRGALYQKRIPNPALKIVQMSERQLVALAKQLATCDAVPVEKKSSAQLLADVDKMLEGVN